MAKPRWKDELWGSGIVAPAWKPSLVAPGPTSESLFFVTFEVCGSPQNSRFDAGLASFNPSQDWDNKNAFVFFMTPWEYGLCSVFKEKKTVEIEKCDRTWELHRIERVPTEHNDTVRSFSTDWICTELRFVLQADFIKMKSISLLLYMETWGHLDHYTFAVLNSTGWTSAALWPWQVVRWWCWDKCTCAGYWLSGLLS